MTASGKHQVRRRRSLRYSWEIVDGDVTYRLEMTILRSLWRATTIIPERRVRFVFPGYGAALETFPLPVARAFRDAIGIMS